MPTESDMKKAMQQYIDGFNQSDANILISLIADNAQIEDPFGSGNMTKGKDAITSWYQGAVKVVEKLELISPISGSHSNAAAMAFTVVMKNGQRINAIDVMTFNDAGKIVDMKAYHGPGDVTEI